jgi:hypothetical protein
MLSAVDALRRCGPEATRTELLELTTARRLRAAVEAGTIVRSGRGRYSRPGEPPDLAAALAHGAVVSHLSAAEHWDLPVLSRPDVPQLTVPRHRRVAPEPKATIRYGPVSPADRRDRVTSPARTVRTTSPGPDRRCRTALHAAHRLGQRGDPARARGGGLRVPRSSSRSGRRLPAVRRAGGRRLAAAPVQLRAHRRRAGLDRRRRPPRLSRTDELAIGRTQLRVQPVLSGTSAGERNCFHPIAIPGVRRYHQLCSLKCSQPRIGVP